MIPTRHSGFLSSCFAIFLGFSSQLHAGFIAPEIVSGPYFKKGLKAGQINGTKHAKVLSCAQETVAIATEIEWVNPEENPYLFGYYFGYLQAFEQSRSAVLLDCSGQYTPGSNIPIVATYEKLHREILQSIQAIDCRTDACTWDDVLQLSGSRKYWATVLLVDGEAVIGKLNQVRDNLQDAIADDFQKKNIAAKARVQQILERSPLTAADLLEIKQALEDIQPIENLQTLPGFNI